MHLLREGRGLSPHIVHGEELKRGPPFPALSAMALVTGLKLTRDIGVSTSQRDGRMYLGAPAQVFSVTSMLSI
jgi:hypothetical protein